ncbi:MAG: hypothetical protein IPO49_16110 [Bacteroidetes bacterium]|nr:hypothetical protein [Bacteroidota bacterium]
MTITEPAALVATCSVVSHVSCNGGTDGAADVIASGGTAPYTGTGSFTGLAAGTYTYNVSDANGCTASCSVTITEPAALVATCSVVSHVSCNGGSDGSASVSASGGTAPYTGTGSFTGLAAGSYTYNISDANGCTASCSVTITEPTVLLASCTFVSDASCNGGSDGSASVSASGGTAPYSGTGLIAGLSAGTQTLTVTDANGCTATCSVTISEPAALVATCSVVSNVSCNGGTDGAADVTASGGTAPYTGTGSFTGLAAGTYTYNVSDANGCTASCSVTITEPAALVATCSVVSHVSCNGGTDGAADVTASGGTAPYTGTGSFTGLAAGSYTYNVSDASGCTASCSVTITEPAALVATCSVTANVSCNGGTDGAADVTASGGTAPYTGTGSFTGLAAGSYTYNISDANGCTASCSVTITEPAALVATCSVVANVSCNGGTDGSADVTASGGTAPYTGTGSFTGLAAGTYTYNVSDANGCTASCSVTITEPAALVATCSVVSHVSCNGGTDGAADVTASGGTAPYTGTGSFTGLAAGTYTYNVSDANGCTASCSVTITEPAALVATCSVVSHVSCNGGTDGAADVTASGGTAPYTGTGSFTGLAAGTYTYNVSDANGCTATCSVTITEPAALVATCSVTANVSCNGGSDGAADVTASGGTAPYTGTGSFTGLAAGSYTYNISDANGCTTSCSVTITEPTVLLASCTFVSDVTCNGGSDGTASVSVSGGTAPYSGVGLVIGLPAGNQTLTVTDANGCTSTCTVVISEPTALVATCSVVANVSCNGGTNGAADVTASGGTAPYTGTGSFTGLAAGSYTYNISDANGCTASCSVTITEPAALVATCSVVANVSCNGGTDGAADVTASGGTAPYTGTGSFTGLAAGTYTYNVSDASGCTASCSVTITEPAALVATCSVVSHVSCNGGTDGAADVTASGGTAPYTGTGSFTGLAAGTYTYNVSDANGCTASCSVTITEPAALVATCSVVSNVSCNGGTDGAADVTASGGTAPYTGTGSFTGLAAGTYTYNVSDANGCTASCSVTITEPAALVATCSVTANVSCNGGTDGAADVTASGGTAPYTGTGSFTGLAAGTYTYNVSDANGCTASCSVTITEPAALVATCSVVSNVTCNGGSDGSADVTASGGTAPYTGTGSFTGLTAGTYTYNVSDANGCTATCSVTITEPAALVATCSVTANVSCNGGSDGSADVTASGGTAPYTGTGSFTGLAAGTYTYNVSDANGCTASCSVTITEPAALVATCSVTANVSCNGGSDGSADVTASGGTAPYTGTGSFTGLAAGTYTYNVSDANGCTASCSVTITEPAALVAACSVTANVSCNGGSDGSANVTASGGTAPYTGTGSFTGLAAGTYTYNVSDANGCTASCSVTITEPAALVATCSVVSNVSCNGGTDGAADVTASGGTAPYTGTGPFTGLAAGTYTYNVSDANGCTASCSVTITEPAALVATCSVVSNVSCNGGTDGAADVTASGGTAPYTGTGSFTSLAAGTYTYNVSDANGCTASCSVTITEPAALVATCSVVSNVSCNGGTDGAADVTASGGTAPYTGTGSFTGLAAGTYTYNVSDANGCTASCSVTITEPAALVATCSVVSNVTCNGGSDGSADVTASGGTAPYTGTGSFTGLAAGTYTYNVSDANGCTASCSVTITEPAALVATCSVVSNVTCNGGSDGSADVTASGGTAPYTGTGSFTGLAAGTYTYNVSDANGCTASCSVTITEPAALVANCSVTANVSCNGGTDGAADVTASGGTAPYTGTGSFTGLAAGTYTYNVSDANGCTASCSVTITEPAALVATCSVVSHVSCNGGTDGAADVSASGGTAPYTGTGSFTGLAAGTYTYNVSDASGCTASCSVTITEPAALVATCSVTANVSCNGGTDGAADVTASGGTAPYTGTGSFTGLAAGTYTYNVSDANGCTASCSVTITEPAALVATCSVVSHVSCNGGTDGSADVTASGGTAPYTGTGSFTGLAAGTYTYNVSDANGCTASCSVTITEPAALVATCSVVSHVSCNGGTDGSADVTASGGTAPYTGTGSFTGLAAGTYTYNVSDANGCTSSCSVTITEPAALVATCSVVSNVSCNGGTDGAADVTASGGTAPYTGTGSFTGLAAGTYTYNVSDANGCTASCSVTITEPAALVATCSVVSNVTCNGGSDGSADVTASGGTAPYTGTGSFTGLAAGTYTYNVSDANGCTASCSVTITEPAALVATCSVVSVTYCSGSPDEGGASLSSSLHLVR